MNKTDYIPISLIEYIRPSTGSPGLLGEELIIIKLKDGAVWETKFDIVFSKHGTGIEGDFTEITD